MKPSYDKHSLIAQAHNSGLSTSHLASSDERKGAIEGDPCIIHVGTALFQDGNPITLQPSQDAAILLADKLTATPHNQWSRYVLVKNFDTLFREHGLRVFEGAIEGSRNELNDATTFALNWIHQAYKVIKRADSHSGAIDSKYLMIDGLGDNTGEAFERGLADFGGPRRYYLGAMLGIRKALDKLTRMSNGKVLLESFYKDAIRAEFGGSVKRPHFDSHAAITCIQKFSEGIKGGDPVFYDVGRFCRDRNIKPWELLVPMATDPRSVPAAARLKEDAYVVLVPRQEYNDELRDSYATVVPMEPGDVLIFNNGIDYDAQSGEVHAIAHGASPINVEGSAKRVLALSFAFDM
jgi:hypothetical protein